MAEYWEKTFKDKQAMWGFEPAESTVLAKNFFVEQKLKDILILGIGYGRNAQIFRDNGMTVTGIEISKTAIDLAHKYFGDDLVIHHGSVTQMPFDNNLYDGIYCYALIHLLDKKERLKLIEDCYNQLTENGWMLFAVITKEAPIYGRGTHIDHERYEMFGGIKMFYYDHNTILEEFGNVGLLETTTVADVYPFYLIKCKKVH